MGCIPFKVVSVSLFSGGSVALVARPVTTREGTPPFGGLFLLQRYICFVGVVLVIFPGGHSDQYEHE